MPKQEIFFEQQDGDRKIEVLKSYDQVYAREAFSSMNEEGLKHLWSALKPEDVYDPSDLPSLNDPNDLNGEAEAFLWYELLEQSREDGNLLSFFIVNESNGRQSRSLYVSPDWPSAESYAKERLIIEPAQR